MTSAVYVLMLVLAIGAWGYAGWRILNFLADWIRGY